jgi:hemerythrin
MAKVTWTDDLEMGVPVLDEQHKELIALVLQIIELINSQGSRRRILDLLRKFKNDAIKHFSTEEKLMDASYYTDKKGHKKLHVHFMKELQETINKIERGIGGAECAEELKENVAEWFIHHIRKNDVTLASYIGGKA